MFKAPFSTLGGVGRRALTLARAQTNARFWLAQFVSEPLPEEAEVPFERLVANAKLLSQVGSALCKTSLQGLAVVPAVDMRVGEAWEETVGAARAGRVADDAASFIAACRSLGVRSVECCSTLDITHPGPSSARAVRRCCLRRTPRLRALTARCARAPCRFASRCTR